jgi:hypothetical protein
VRLAKMDSVCNFITKYINDTEEFNDYIPQDYDEYHGDMANYVISYLKTSLGDMVIDPRVIIENQKPIVLFSTDYRHCKIHEFTGSYDEGYWVVSIIDREPKE